jgi:hypothetical protein
MRKRARKLVLLPGGDTMYIPCLVQLPFINAADQYQEVTVFCDSTAESSRKVHVDQVDSIPVDADGNPTGGGPTGAGKLYVERIDEWHTLTMAEQAQEQVTFPDNVTGHDTQPPRFTTHKKTHVYRYYKDPDNQSNALSWIDAEVIDEFDGLTMADQAQETHWLLDNAYNGDLSGQADPVDPDITIGSGEGTSDNPIRLDPFQNIINWNAGPPYIIFGFSIITSGMSGQPVARQGDHNVLPTPSGNAFSAGYTTAQSVSSFPSASPAFASDGTYVNFSGGPRINKEIGFSNDQYMAAFGDRAIALAGVVNLTFTGTTVYVDPDTGAPVPGYYTNGAAHYAVFNWAIGSEGDWFTPAGVFQISYAKTAYGGGDFSNASAIANGVQTDSGGWGWSGFSCSPVSGPGAGSTYNAVAMSLSGGILCKR